MTVSIVDGWPRGVIGISDMLSSTEALGVNGFRQLEWARNHQRNRTSCHSIPTRRDSASLSPKENTYALAFVRLLMRGDSMVSHAFGRDKIVHYSPVEGSFYPFGLLHAFVREVWSDSVFEEASERLQNGTACPCMCLLYTNDTHGCGKEGAQSHAPEQGCTGACTFEETLLPTFAAQRVTDEAEWRRASPPIVLSVLPSRSVNWSATSSALVRFGAAVLRSALPNGSHPSAAGRSGGVPYLFALKVPRHAFPETELLVDRARQLARAQSKARGGVWPSKVGGLTSTNSNGQPTAGDAELGDEDGQGCS
jgi:hypothetical protein